MKKKFNISNFNNKSDLLYTYSSNKFFEDYVFQKEYFPYQFDSWKDKINYGILYKNKFVYPKDILFSGLTNNNRQSFTTLAFVADAFNDLKAYTKQFQLGAKLANQESIYSRLQIKSALKSLNDEYIKYADNLYYAFEKIFLIQISEKAEINSFHDFIKYFIRYLKILTNYSTFSRSGFLASNRCDLAVSGLVINLDDSLLFFDADSKEKKFISDPDFEFFVENAKRFGFYVDKNIPWRIVADLESPIMKDYCKRYNINSLDDLFLKHYHVAYYADLESNKNMIVAFWNRFVETKKRNTQAKQVINCKNIFLENTNYKKMSVEMFELNYNINWQLRLHIYIKILESKLLIKQKTFDQICDNSYQINQNFNLNSALDYINDKINEISTLQRQKNSDLTEQDYFAKIAIERQNVLESDLLFF